MRNKPFALEVARVREMDRRATEEMEIPSLLLMENAGRSVAEQMGRRFLKKAALKTLVMVFCGKGNNGGDGFVIARHLFQQGHHVQAFLLYNPQDLEGDAALNYRIINRIGVPARPFQKGAFYRKAPYKKTVIVDALLGTGFKGPARPPVEQAIKAINDFKKRTGSRTVVVAVDIPSGLDGDKGLQGPAAVKADWTFTFACLKPGLLRKASKPFVGRVRVVDIGIPKKLIDLYRT